ncbi:ABC transporter permease [Chitinophaga lutea]|uniref:ABC transporter permease n=1 Tax=Chitinophaga lutea TaxID=2488634 RepID=A0A3N4Q0S1_9BACT|nr:ABC transporter permease [Chitinophaga lutea]RPE13818.1 ABC transporter permease [Chitinophaga lutea]
MFHNVKIAWRTLSKQKLYAAINIGGLAIGLAVTTLLLMWRQDELSYDAFHPGKENIYEVHSTFESGGSMVHWINTQAAVAAHSLRSVPGVKEAVRVSYNQDMSRFQYRDRVFFEKQTGYVDERFFSLFNFPLLKGDRNKPFRDNNSVVVSSSIAKKYFEDEEPIGKVITIDGKHQFTVTGVMEDMPLNSSIRYDMLFPFDRVVKSYAPNGYWKTADEDWGNFYVRTYLQLQPETNLDTTAARLGRLWVTQSPNEGIERRGYLLQSLTDVHFYEVNGKEGLIRVIRVFFLIAIVILLIACINYINLSTARASQRAVEVGVRKAIGANRVQLFRQFISESVLVFGIAVVLAVALLYFLLPFCNDLTGKNMTLSLLDGRILGILGFGILFMLLLAGVYPALLLTSFDPLNALKGKITAAGRSGFFRKGLVVTQFVISVVLIGSTLVIGLQLRYIHNKPLGFDKENVFIFPVRNMQEHAAAVKQQLAAIPGVTAVTYGHTNIMNVGSSTSDTDWEGKAPGQSLNVTVIGADADFVPSMKLTIKEGRAFRPGPADSASYVLNEETVRLTGLKDPVGKRFRLYDTEGTVIGVVKDFHSGDMHYKIRPLVMFYKPEGWQLYVKTDGQRTAAVVDSIGKIWSRYNPDYPFEPSFLDMSYSAMYAGEARTGKLFLTFAGVAVFLSCLGLFGLATFSISQRTKEIGIRKVLGASVPNIIQLISKDFLKLVLIAIVIATPIAWYAMQQWLSSFAYSIPVPVWAFAAAGVVAVLIALFTVSFQSIKAALVNPVHSLKSE